MSILTNTDEMTSRVVAERFRAAVEADPWPVETITISVGASTHRGAAVLSRT